MKIAVCSDEPYPVNDVIVTEIKKRGHEAILFGSPRTKKEAPWITVTAEAAKAVSEGRCDEGIFFCWTGTGSAIAANKISGIRAALCGDAETAKGARIWNHANVLILSNRLTTSDLAKEILEAWFSTPMDDRGEKTVQDIKKLEK